jgi:hypothetical protein
VAARGGISITADQAAFRDALSALKAIDANTYKALRSEIRSIGKRIMREQEQAVKSTSSRGSRSGGAKTRALHAMRITADNGLSGSISASQARRANRATSLRAAAAGALTLEVRERPSARARESGVRIRMRAGKMPGDQKRLPKNMNRGRWRHPVFGNKEVWVSQQTDPPGWFDETFDRQRASATDAITDAFTRAWNSTR